MINLALREGLASLSEAPQAQEPYKIRPSDPGPPALAGVHSVHDMLAYAEGDDPA